MKTIVSQLYEPGDHIRITKGYTKGRVGIVLSHPWIGKDVRFRFAGKDYEGDDSFDDYDSIEVSNIESISKLVYEKELKNQKILVVAGLPVSIQFKSKNFLIGDNVVTKIEAKKIADFIMEYSKPKVKKDRK